MTPAVRLVAHVNHTEIPVEAHERIVAVRLDVITPGESEGGAARPLNLALLIDKSGSMTGPKIQTAKAAALRVIDLLADADTFCLVAFREAHEVIVPACRVGGNRDAIKARISQLAAGGGTRLKDAMEIAATQLRPHMREGVTTAIYVLTDGQVGDAADCLQLTPQLVAQGIGVRAGGIGDDYVLAFLDQLARDPAGSKASELVVHITPENLGAITAKFEEFVKRKGHLVTANCRLTVEVPARRVRVANAVSEGTRKPLVLDATNSAPIGDLPGGITADFHFDLAVLSKVPQDLEFAVFRLRYDIPAAGVVGHVAEARARVKIVEQLTNGRLTSNVLVKKTLDDIKSKQMSEKVEELLEKKDARGATGILERLTGHLVNIGEADAAKDAEALKKKIADSNPENLEAARKGARGLTGNLNSNG